MKKVTSRPVEPEELNIEQKTTLGLSLWLLLAVHFTLNYLTFTYYPEDLLSIRSIGYWILILNNIFLASLVFFNKRAMGWSWSDLGLGKPVNWWQPIIITLITFGALVLFSKLVRPDIIETFGKHQNVSHVLAIKDNLSLLITSTLTMWITAAFLQELVFRAFLIKAFDSLLGKTGWSLWLAVLASAVIFAGVYAHQGITGILITGFVGLVFGIAYIFNGKRLWPLILVHGLVDTLTFISIYNM